ncbi:MAG: hypothetical protein ACE5NJ_03565 [Thermodesulfobacteriota bacterium]
MDYDVRKPRRVRPGALAFEGTGADLIYAAAFLYSKTGEELWLSRALGLADRFSRICNPRTGLCPEILDVLRDPNYSRPEDPQQLGLSSSQHTGSGARYRNYALCQLFLSEMLSGEAGERFLRWAVSDLRAYTQYGYDRDTGGFYTMLRTDTGERIRFSQVRWAPVFYYPPRKFYKNLGLPVIFYAYAKGYRLSKDPLFLQTAERCLNILGVNVGTRDVSLSGFPEEVLNSNTVACLIQGLLDLHQAEQEPWYLSAAQGTADEGLTLFFDGEFFVDWPGEFYQSRVNQAFPLALLRLATALEGREIPLPEDPGGLGEIGYYNVGYIDGDFAIRWQWGKHYSDLHLPGGRMVCRIGDFSPHLRGDDEFWNYAGVWCLKATWSDVENVLDDRRGIIFEPLAKFIPVEMTKTDETEVLVKHWDDGDRTQAPPPYFGVQSRYKLTGPHFLDWTLEVVPLQTDKDLSLRGFAYLNEKASPEVTFLGEDGWFGLPVGENEEIVVKAKGNGATYEYLRPVFYCRVEDVVLVFMFEPDAPIDLLCVGRSDKCPQRMGFIWHIADAENGQMLNVRIGLLPISGVDRAREEYKKWLEWTPADLETADL